MEDPKSALASFERCLELSPDHEDALFGKAVAMQSLGHPDEASQIYQRILKRNPESEESLSNLILIGMSKQDFDMVREHSERLLELHPESTVALEGLASWASSAGEHGLTAKFCTLLVSAVPGHFEGWFNLALAHQKSEPLGAGRRSLRRGDQAAPAVLRGLYQPGNRARAARRRTGARAAYERAMKANPEALAPVWNVALLLEHSGQTRGGRALVQAGAGEGSQRG